MNVYSTIIIVVMLICMTILTYIGKLSPHAITVFVGTIAGWILKTGAVSLAEVRAAHSKFGKEKTPITPEQTS